MERLAQVHLIPTEGEARLFTNKKHPQFMQQGQKNTNTYWQGHNVCWSTDEEIKQGDWILVAEKHIRQVESVEGDKYITVSGNNGVFKHICRKIVATDNEEVWSKIPMEAEGHFLNQPFPKIDDYFYEGYNAAYNAGKKIEEVVLEYEQVCLEELVNKQVSSSGQRKTIETLKLTPQGEVIWRIPVYPKSVDWEIVERIVQQVYLHELSVGTAVSAIKVEFELQNKKQ